MTTSDAIVIVFMDVWIDENLNYSKALAYVYKIVIFSPSESFL